MKLKTTKKLFAFIITVMMFSVLTEPINAQQTCSPQHPCPPGYACVDGHCKFIFCNCSRRPIPPQCGIRCGIAANKNETGKNTFLVSVFSDSVSKSTTISFSLQQSENIAINIFDITGQLVKTFPDQAFEKGEHSLEWNTAGINSGVYTVQLQSSSISQIEKLVVMK